MGGEKNENIGCHLDQLLLYDMQKGAVAMLEKGNATSKKANNHKKPTVKKKT